MRIPTLLAALSLYGPLSCKTPSRFTENAEVKIVDNSLTDVDVLKNGSLAFKEIDYDSGPLIDRDVIPGPMNGADVKTDIRGRLYLPEGEGPFPVLVYLTGNHGTCGISGGEGNPRFDISNEFTLKGTCWPNYAETPSHLGYQASAQQMASWGYAVLAINPNRGINGNGGLEGDFSLLYARGALVLRHLEEFYTYARDGVSTDLKPGDLDLKAKLDFKRVGFMGHSRGGEGVRLAYNIYNNSLKSEDWKRRIPGMLIKAIFEIGPIDYAYTGEFKENVEARGTSWNVLIPGCDYDVSDFQGTQPFARMLASQSDAFPKSIFTLWGANHNFFNSEWQVSDAPHKCVGDQIPLWDTSGALLGIPAREAKQLAKVGLLGSSKQIIVEKALLFSFFQAHLGNDPKLRHVFDPQYRLPTQIRSIAPSSREYVSGAESKVILNSKAEVEVPQGAEGLSVLTFDAYIDSLMASLTQKWRDYGRRKGFGEFSILLDKNSFRRESLVIRLQNNEAQSLVLPFPVPADTEGFWTIDLVAALRKECYDFDENLQSTCPKGGVNSSFNISLVRADGSESAAVAIKDYIDLSNAHKSTLVYGNGDDPNPRWFGPGPQTLGYRIDPVIYQTVRFELTDFGGDNSRLKGIKLQFPQNAGEVLMIESLRLSRRP